MLILILKKIVFFNISLTKNVEKNEISDDYIINIYQEITKVLDSLKQNYNLNDHFQVLESSMLIQNKNTKHFISELSVDVF